MPGHTLAIKKVECGKTADFMQGLSEWDSLSLSARELLFPFTHEK